MKSKRRIGSFSSKNINMDWKKVVFSDEKKLTYEAQIRILSTGGMGKKRKGSLIEINSMEER